MKLPVCEKDIESRDLCGECSEKLRKGKITQTDIELSRILHKLTKKGTIRNCPDLITTKQIEEKQVLSLVEGDPANLIGKGGRIIRLISEELGKEVRIVKNGNILEMTNDLITPAKTYGVNTLYRTTGEKKKRITVPREMKNKINMDPKKAEESIKKLKGEKYELKFV